VSQIALFNATPTVSVLLPVYNGVCYIREAIDSILNQTYGDFELIIINDGSTDETGAIIQNFKDERIRVYGQPNKHLPATLNRAIGLSRGKYLARHDHDDIAMPRRLEKQVAFLNAHPNCGMVGTWASIWDEAGVTERVHNHPAGNLALKYELLFRNPVVHSSVMMRRAVLQQVGAYSTDARRQPPEDYELWSRISRVSDVANIAEVLQIYREVGGSMSRSADSSLLDRIVDISAENLAWYAGKREPDPNFINLSALVNRAFHRLCPTVSLQATISTLLVAAWGLAQHRLDGIRTLQFRIAKTLVYILKNYAYYRFILRSGAPSSTKQGTV
jgi:glycosyltransferase involved in cell wall biosynthesis